MSQLSCVHKPTIHFHISIIKYIQLFNTYQTIILFFLHRISRFFGFILFSSNNVQFCSMVWYSMYIRTFIYNCYFILTSVHFMFHTVSPFKLLDNILCTVSYFYWIEVFQDQWFSFYYQWVEYCMTFYWNLF